MSTWPCMKIGCPELQISYTQNIPDQTMTMILPTKFTFAQRNLLSSGGIPSPLQNGHKTI